MGRVSSVYGPEFLHALTHAGIWGVTSQDAPSARPEAFCALTSSRNSAMDHKEGGPSSHAY